jgi:hypothetical protein
MSHVKTNFSRINKDHETVTNKQNTKSNRRSGRKHFSNCLVAAKNAVNSKCHLERYAWKPNVKIAFVIRLSTS